MIPKAKFSGAVATVLTSLVLNCLFLLLPATALADSIDFTAIGTGAGSGWSWAGGAGSTLTATGIPVDVSRIGSTPLGPFLLPLATLSWTTGGALSGSGTLTDPFLWATPGTITVSDGTTTFFSGTFTAAQLAFNGGALIFDATGISGTLNSGLLAFLGFPNNPNATGAMSATLSGSATFSGGGSGSFSSGDLNLTPAPEPSSLLLLGAGLLFTPFLRIKRAY